MTIKMKLKKFIAGFLLFSTLLVTIILLFDYYKFRLEYHQYSKQNIDQVVRDILAFNAKQRKKVSQLFIKHAGLIRELSHDPENSELLDNMDKLFKQNFPAYFTFIIADNHGELITDDFFEKVGRMCRQDIKEFAINGQTSWLVIHPGPAKYHYDMIIPWQFGKEPRRIIFISFLVDELATILRQHETDGRQLFIVRKDRNNLVELGSKGSRYDLYHNVVFLSDNELFEYKADIKGTYWTVVEKKHTNLLKLYLKHYLFSEKFIQRLRNLFKMN